MDAPAYIAMRQTVVVCAVGIPLLILASGCSDAVVKPPANTDIQADFRKYDHEANNPVDMIALSDTALYPDNSGERILTGDMRPLYVAEGRVKSSLSHSNAEVVVVKVYLEDKDKKNIDMASILIKDIPPHGIKAFRAKVQLLPPRGEKYYMDFDVDSVQTSPFRSGTK